MFIQIEPTPNPDVMKFVPDVPILAPEAAMVDFPTMEEARGVSPLAEALFAVDGVRSVFFGPDFISVAREDGVDWPVLQPFIIERLTHHLTAGLPVFSDSANAQGGGEGAGGEAGPDLPVEEKDREIVAQIEDLLNTRVRPAVAMDGGDIVFQGYKDGVVFLALRGACAGCPSSTMTLKMGVENMLCHYIPDVVEVRAC